MIKSWKSETARWKRCAGQGMWEGVPGFVRGLAVLLALPCVHQIAAAAAAKLLQLCPSWPHRRQPTRLRRPWDSPGKNTGVGCHFLLRCMKVKSESEVAQLCPTLSDPMDWSLPGSSIHGIFQARVLEWGAIAFSVTNLGAVQIPGYCAFRRFHPGNSTGVDCHFLLQRIFPTQGSNPGLTHCRQTLYHLSHQGSPFTSFLHHIDCYSISSHSPLSVEWQWGWKFQAPSHGLALWLSTH